MAAESEGGPAAAEAKAEPQSPGPARPGAEGDEAAHAVDANPDPELYVNPSLLSMRGALGCTYSLFGVGGRRLGSRRRRR